MRRRQPLALAIDLIVLLAPACLLAFAAIRTGSSLLAAGATIAVVGASILSKYRYPWRPPSGWVLIFLYGMSAAWVWTNSRASTDASIALTRTVLVGSTLALLIIHDLYRTGSEPRRRARYYCHRLQSRRWWPETIEEISLLPEVQKLRTIAEVEPGPIFNLFNDPRAEVRSAAFLAMSQRTGWRPREAAVILSAAQATLETPVRIAAINTLGNVDEPAAFAGLTSFFRDRCPEVRQAAIRAALRDGGRKWAFVRDGVRLALSDPKTVPNERNGLLGSEGSLPVVAICDLTAWAGEPEPLGTRATVTLIDHYARQLQSTTVNFRLISELMNQVTDDGTPTALRVELASLLRTYGMLTADLLDRMTNSDQPGPIRLLATEALLDVNPSHPDALDVLRGLARQPNREMSLAIARILQFRLGIDIGFPTSGKLAANSKAAGEIARRVLTWATGRALIRESDEVESSPQAGEIMGIPLSSPPSNLPGSSADLNADRIPPVPGRLRTGNPSW